MIEQLKDQLMKANARANELRQRIDALPDIEREYYALVGRPFSRNDGEIAKLTKRVVALERIESLSGNSRCITTTGDVLFDYYVTKVTAKRIYYTQVQSDQTLHDSYYQLGQYNYNNIDFDTTVRAYNG